MSSDSSASPSVSPPSRSERTKCWLARDKYFSCLDCNSVVVPAADPARSAVCPIERSVFERDCIELWQKHFLELRLVKKRNELMQKGQPPQISTPATSVPAPSSTPKPADRLV